MVLSLWISSGRTMPATIQFADFEVDADLLLAFDHEVAVRQHLGYHGGDVGLQRFLAVDRALAVAGRGGGLRSGIRPGRILFACVMVWAPMKLVTPESSLLVRLRWVSFGEVGLVGDVDGHVRRSPMRAARWVLEEGARAVPPQRVAL